jgi:hypothetical protein
MRRAARARRPVSRRVLSGAAGRMHRDRRGQSMAEYLMILLALIIINELSGIVAGQRVLSFPDWENSFVGQGILVFYEGVVRLASSPVP